MPTTAAVEHHSQRYDALVEARRNFDNDAQSIVELICPFADDVTISRFPGEPRTERLFDVTAVLANDELAASLLGDMSSPAIQWYKFGFRDQALETSDTVKNWCEYAGETQLKAYGASNFYETVQIFHKYRQAFGTAAMYAGSVQSSQDPSQSTLRFKNLPYGTYCIAENEHGVVDTLYRCIKYTPRQAVQQFRVVPDLVRRNFADPAKKDVPQDYIQCVYPRKDRDPERYDNRNMPYASLVYLKEGKEQVEESGFQEFPFIVSRWETMGNSPWGYGLGHLALPLVRVLNALIELNLQQLAVWAQPPMEALYEGIVGNISLASLAINYVKSMGNIKPMDFTGRPDLVQINQDQLKAEIKSIFYSDVLQAIPPADASKMTAYEVAQRLELRTRRIGPAFHRLTSEMFDRLADRVFGLLYRAGQILPPPREVLEAAARNRGQLDVEYTGMLARAQKGGDVRAINDTVLFVGQVAEMTQSMAVWDVLKLDDMVRHVADVQNVPVKLIQEGITVQQIRAARQQQQQQLIQAEEQRQNLAAISRTAPIVSAMQKAA